MIVFAIDHVERDGVWSMRRDPGRVEAPAIPLVAVYRRLEGACVLSALTAPKIVTNTSLFWMCYPHACTCSHRGMCPCGRGPDDAYMRVSVGSQYT